MFHRGIRMALLLAPVLVFSVCSPAFADQTVTKAAPEGNAVAAAASKRIVSIGGAVTEILYALNLQDRIVGVDLTSTFPAAVSDKPQVGYMRNLSVEGVLSLSPDLVIAIEGAGPPDTIEVLERASVPFVLVPEGYDSASPAAKVRFIAKLLGQVEKGEALATAIEADLRTIDAMRASIEDRRKAIFVLGMSTGAPLAAGGNTAAAGMFALAGIENALSGFDGYKPASDEAAIAAEPDAIVIMSERGHQLTPEIVFSVPAFVGTPAASHQRLIALPGGYLLNFGPRTAHAAHDLAAAIYPEFELPELPQRPWAPSAEIANH